MGRKLSSCTQYPTRRVPRASAQCPDFRRSLLDNNKFLTFTNSRNQPPSLHFFQQISIFLRNFNLVKFFITVVGGWDLLHLGWQNEYLSSWRSKGQRLNSIISTSYLADQTVKPHHQFKNVLVCLLLICMIECL